MSERQIPDFASVALVDILANGVGMLIILIVLSISSRFEAEQRQLEQVGEASVVLSRTISTDIVRNRLAASPPAQLHSYQNSPLDRVRDPLQLPILELHRDFVRDYYSSAVYSREELLLEDNRLDEALAAFTPRQRNTLRIDMYAVREFYLAMSVLRSHGIGSRHWHFVRGGGMSVRDAVNCPPGVPGSQCVGFGGRGESAQNRAAQALRSLLGEVAATEDGAAGVAEDGVVGAAEDGVAGGETAGAGRGPQLPDGGDLRDLGQSGAASERYPAMAAEDSAAAGWAAGRRSGADPGSPQGAESDFDALMRSMGQASVHRGAGEQGQGGQPGDPQLSRATFRFAGPPADTQQSADRQSRVPLPSLRVVLAVLLQYMREIEDALDNDRSVLSLVSNFSATLIQRFVDPPPPRAEDQDLIDGIVRLFIERWPDSEPLQVEQRWDDSVAGLSAVLPVNVALQQLALRGDSLQDALEGLPAARHVALRLNNFPTIYQGMELILQRDAVLLMAPEQRQPEEYHWRVVSYIPPSFDNFVLGFVYAIVTEDAQLSLHPAANHIVVGTTPLRVLAAPRSVGVLGWLALCFATVVLGLVLVLLFELRRRRQSAVVTLGAAA